LVKACLADPLFVHAHIAVGLAHTAAHEGDQALQCFREASRLFPGAHVANIAMGRELLRTGSPQLAERLLRSVQAPGDSHVLNELGVSLYEQGRLEAALTVFTQGLTLCRATFPRPRDDSVFVALCINAGDGCVACHMSHVTRHVRFASMQVTRCDGWDATARRSCI
jgi:Tfp pilus assembly protein PilF